MTFTIEKLENREDLSIGCAGSWSSSSGERHSGQCSSVWSISHCRSHQWDAL